MNTNDPKTVEQTAEELWKSAWPNYKMEMTDGQKLTYHRIARHVLTREAEIRKALTEATKLLKEAERFIALDCDVNENDDGYLLKEIREFLRDEEKK